MVTTGKPTHFLITTCSVDPAGFVRDRHYSVGKGSTVKRALLDKRRDRHSPLLAGVGMVGHAHALSCDAALAGLSHEELTERWPDAFTGPWGLTAVELYLHHEPEWNDVGPLTTRELLVVFEHRVPADGSTTVEGDDVVQAQAFVDLALEYEGRTFLPADRGIEHDFYRTTGRDGAFARYRVRWVLAVPSELVPAEEQREELGAIKDLLANPEVEVLHREDDREELVRELELQQQHPRPKRAPGTKAYLFTIRSAPNEQGHRNTRRVLSHGTGLEEAWTIAGISLLAHPVDPGAGDEVHAVSCDDSLDDLSDNELWDLLSPVPWHALGEPLLHPDGRPRKRWHDQGPVGARRAVLVEEYRTPNGVTGEVDGDTRVRVTYRDEPVLVAHGSILNPELPPGWGWPSEEYLDSHGLSNGPTIIHPGHEDYAGVSSYLCLRLITVPYHLTAQGLPNEDEEGFHGFRDRTVYAERHHRDELMEVLSGMVGLDAKPSRRRRWERDGEQQWRPRTYTQRLTFDPRGLLEQIPAMQWEVGEILGAVPDPVTSDDAADALHLRAWVGHGYQVECLTVTDTSIFPTPRSAGAADWEISYRRLRDTVEAIALGRLGALVESCGITRAEYDPMRTITDRRTADGFGRIYGVNEESLTTVAECTSAGTTLWVADGLKPETVASLAAVFRQGAVAGVHHRGAAYGRELPTGPPPENHDGPFHHWLFTAALLGPSGRPTVTSAELGCGSTVLEALEDSNILLHRLRPFEASTDQMGPVHAISCDAAFAAQGRIFQEQRWHRAFDHPWGKPLLDAGTVPLTDWDDVGPLRLRQTVTVVQYRALGPDSERFEDDVSRRTAVHIDQDLALRDRLFSADPYDSEDWYQDETFALPTGKTFAPVVLPGHPGFQGEPLYFTYWLFNAPPTLQRAELGRGQKALRSLLERVDVKLVEHKHSRRQLLEELAKPDAAPA